MIDLTKELEVFNEQFGLPEPDNNFLGETTAQQDKHSLKCNWLGWQRRAELAQQEINDLKQQLAEAHKSRASWVEYSQKIENGEFVLVPREPTHEMLRAAYKHVMDCHATPESAYKVMIEAVEKDHE